MIRVLLIVLSLIAAGSGATLAYGEGPGPAGELISPELRERSLTVLRGVKDRQQSRFCHQWPGCQ